MGKNFRLQKSDVLRMKIGDSILTSTCSWKLVGLPEETHQRGVKLTLLPETAEHPVFIYLGEDEIFRSSSGKENDQLNLHLIGVVTMGAVQKEAFVY